jgi:hypothetical protein
MLAIEYEISRALIPELGDASGSRTPNLDVRLGVGALLFDLRQRRFIPP